jgi:hypothetical protein
VPAVRGEPVERIGYRVVVAKGNWELYRRDFLTREWGKTTEVQAKHHARKISCLFPCVTVMVYELCARVW